MTRQQRRAQLSKERARDRAADRALARAAWSPFVGNVETDILLLRADGKVRVIPDWLVPSVLETLGGGVTKEEIDRTRATLPLGVVPVLIVIGDFARVSFVDTIAPSKGGVA